MIENRPQLGATFDRSHPLSRGLVLALPLNETGTSQFRNAVDGSLWLPDAQANWSRDRVGLRGTGTTGESSLAGSLAAAAGAYTIEVVLMRVGDAASYLVDTGQGNRIVWNSGVSSDVYTGHAFAAISVPTSRNRWQQFIERGGEISDTVRGDLWVDGARVHATNITPSLVPAITLIGSPALGAFGDVLGWVRIWNRCLHDSELSTIIGGRWPNLARSRAILGDTPSSPVLGVGVARQPSFAQGSAAILSPVVGVGAAWQSGLSQAAATLLRPFVATAFQPSIAGCQAVPGFANGHQRVDSRATAETLVATPAATSGQVATAGAMGSALVPLLARAFAPATLVAAATTRTPFRATHVGLSRSSGAASSPAGGAAKAFGRSHARGQSAPVVVSSIAAARQSIDGRAVATALANASPRARQATSSAAAATLPTSVAAAAAQPFRAVAGSAGTFAAVAKAAQSCVSAGSGSAVVSSAGKTNQCVAAASSLTSRQPFAAVASQAMSARVDIDSAPIAAFGWPRAVAVSRPLFCYAIAV